MNKFAKKHYDKFEKRTDFGADQKIQINSDASGNKIILFYEIVATSIDNNNEPEIDFVASYDRKINMTGGKAQFLINGNLYSFECSQNILTDSGCVSIFPIPCNFLQLACEASSVDIRLSSAEGNDCIDTDSVDLRLLARIMYNAIIDEEAYSKYLDQEYERVLNKVESQDSISKPNVISNIDVTSPHALQLNKYFTKEYDKFNKKTVIRSEKIEFDVVNTDPLDLIKLECQFRYIGVKDQMDTLVIDLEAVSNGGLDLKSGNLIFLIDDNEQFVLEANESYLSDYVGQYKKESDWYKISDEQLKALCDAKTIDIRVTNGRNEYSDVKTDKFQIFARRSYNGLVDNTMYMEDLKSDEERKVEEDKKKEAERRAKAEEEARILREKRKEWWAQNKKKVGFATLIIIGIIVGVCCINMLMTKHNIRMAMSLVEKGDEFANNYQFDQAYACYSDAQKIETDDETSYKVRSRQQLLSTKIQEAEAEYNRNLNRLKILLEADEYVFNKYSNECLDKMIQIAPERDETKYYQNLRGK